MSGAAKSRTFGARATLYCVVPKDIHRGQTATCWASRKAAERRIAQLARRGQSAHEIVTYDHNRR